MEKFSIILKSVVSALPFIAIRRWLRTSLPLANRYNLSGINLSSRKCSN